MSRAAGTFDAAEEHLDRLTARWGLLSDLSFSDLLLYRPDTDSEAVPDAEQRVRFVVDAQVRPTTSQTLYQNDLVGRRFDAEDVPLVYEAWLTGAITIIGDDGSRLVRDVHRECLPVTLDGTVIGVLERVWSTALGRRTGGLERVYVRLFERFAEMIVAGVYPFPTDEDMVDDAPRVGDGVVVLDVEQRINFSSPNAVNALHRVGIVSALIGSTLGELGIEPGAIAEAFASRLPTIEEVERGTDAAVLLHCIPLIDAGRVTGAVLLIRDVTDLRRRDRLLLSKDAAIREVHHRVKNNLQTISSLLRLQLRRVDDAAARTALGEAERRIRAIALVHEILARDPSDQVRFDEIVPALVGLARDTNVRGLPIDIHVGGDVGAVSADVATPLAVVIAELLQNAAEHAFNDDMTERPRIDLEFASDRDHLVATVRDNGSGFRPGFDLERTKSLGLSIVRDLVRTQLAGRLVVESGRGSTITIDVPRA